MKKYKFQKIGKALLVVFVSISNTLGINTNICFAQNLEKPISIQINNSEMANALSTLGKKAGYQINYDLNLFKEHEKANLSANNQPFKEALAKLLNGKNIGFKESDKNTILLYKLAPQQKTGRINGQIVDDIGQPLSDATIKILQNSRTAKSDHNGNFTLPLDPGLYTVEISYLSYKTQRITEVQVKAGSSTPLNIALKPQANTLDQVVVTSNYKKSSTSGLLARQKNASEISNGISAEQILKTPDVNIGESLKRISGINTIDNKFVIVRGIGERYNAAMLDGTVLPSTEANSRQFSFDLIPSDLVDNVVVSKTITPDMNASFGGGLIQINTKDIPTENFMSFTIGSYYNDQSTGKELLSHKRGKYDFLGFDDGRRSFPKNLYHTDRQVAPNNELTDEEYLNKVIDQSKRFTNDNFTVYKYKATPAQNFQFTTGRLFPLNENEDKKVGFTAGLSYRNAQNIDQVTHANRGFWALQRTPLSDSLGRKNTASSYKYSSSLGVIINAGIDLNGHKITSKNTFTQTFSNSLYRITGYSREVGGESFILPPEIEESDRPIFTSLLQNRISGEHNLSKMKLEWNVGLTSIYRKEKDISQALQAPIKVDNEYKYFYYPGTNFLETRVRPLSRQTYNNSESHYTWGISSTLPFQLFEQGNNLKFGYFGQRKHGNFDWIISSLAANIVSNPELQYLPIHEMANPNNMGKNGFRYLIGSMNADGFDGKSQLDAFYAQFDNRFTNKLKLVWGIRAEKFKYTELKTPPRSSVYPKGIDSTYKEKEWIWMPSANLTYEVIPNLNLRAAWSKSIIRPELLDNNEFLIYSPYLGGEFSNFDLKSSTINSLDFKAEWYPGSGEIISIGAFHKHFINPIELSITVASENFLYIQSNSDFAKVSGLEIEFRKKMGFISEGFLNDFTVFGNLTMQKSIVQASFEKNVMQENGQMIKETLKVKNNRPMYGNAPFFYNAGVQYDAKKLNFNIIFHKTAYKTYIISDAPNAIEYEMPRSQFDFQIGYRFLKERLLVKANASNILNSVSSFYKNTGSYTKPAFDKDEEAVFKPGFSAHYDEGDAVTYTIKPGRTYSILLTYTF